MERADLADLTAFVAIADARSFRAAASRLGVTPSALSHAMRQLEERLGMRLLHRTTRSVSVTDAGQRLLERLRPAIDQIAGALEDLNQERERPVGRLRIYASHLASAVVVPIWGRFLSTYPDVHLELAVGEAPIDIVARQFDAGIGPHDRVPADMVAVRVTAPMKVVVVGAPSYFARRPPPRTPDDLARHSCVEYRRGPDVFTWPFERNRKSRRIAVAGRVMVNTPTFPCARPSTGSASPTRSKRGPSRSCVRDSWCPCWKTGRRRSRGCSSITPDTVRSRPRCAPSST